jgi:hypothetical protein
MRALIAGAAAAASPEPVSFLLPVRQASLFRWCLAEGMRVVKPMTLMAVGEYREPRGVWSPRLLLIVRGRCADEVDLPRRGRATLTRSRRLQEIGRASCPAERSRVHGATTWPTGITGTTLRVDGA